MNKIVIPLFVFLILILAACGQAASTPEIVEPTQAPTQASEAVVEPTTEPTQAPTNTAEPTAIPPTPTDEPPAEPTVFMSNRITLDDLADELTIYEVLLANQDTLGQFLADGGMNFAILFSGAFEEPFTVFAPTYTSEDIEGVFPSKDQLDEALKYYIVPGLYLEADLLALDGQSIPTALKGQEINISVKDGVVYLNDIAMVIRADILAQYGIIHVIDRFLVPRAE